MPRPEAVARYRHSFKGRATDAAYHRMLRQTWRAEAIAAYGGKCACCGEWRDEFLTIDHIFGNPEKDKRGRRIAPHQFYSRLRKAGWPKDKYQCLCWNCNAAKAFRGGCPHSLEDAARAALSA